MEIFELIMLIVLLVSALFIIIAVILQKSNEDGLSGAISGSSDTFYGRDKSSHTDRALFKWTLISSIVFVLSVVVVFVIQPDFSQTYGLKDWMTDTYLNGYTDVFK